MDIDKYHSASGDKAYFEGHYYSQAAPGTSFMAVPVVFLTKLYLESNQKEIKWVHESKRRVTLNFIIALQFATIVISGLLTALTGLFLYLVALRLGFGLSGAVFGSLTFGLATPAWGWSTTFFGHSSASGFLFLGFTAIYYLLNSKAEKRRDILLAFSAGALLSWAVVVEYTSAPASVIIALYGVIAAWGWERERLIRILICAFSGALLFILPLLLYHYKAFGDPFVTGYKYHVTLTRVNEGFYGIKLPKLQVAGSLLFGLKRGIFWISPILLLVPIALYGQWKTPGKKGLAIMIAFIAASYLVWSSAYVYWTAGASTGPRLITPMLPFLCLSLAFLWGKAGRVLKAIMLLFSAISFVISLMSVSVSMFIQNPSKIHLVSKYIVPKFLEAGHLKTSLIVRLIAPSFDGTSHMHLLPFYIILTVGFIYILWELHKYNAREVDS